MHGELVTHYTPKLGQQILHGVNANGGIHCIPTLVSNYKVKYSFLVMHD
jgi:hypothetical protein